ncbi:MAG: hypothetical protein AAB875_05150, partial [Patescibacteria group bacterium]
MDYVQRAQQLLIAELERQHISTYAFFDDRGDLICKYEDTRRTENILNLSSITKKQHIDDLHVFDQEILKFFRQNFSMQDLSSNLRGLADYNAYLELRPQLPTYLDGIKRVVQERHLPMPTPIIRYIDRVPLFYGIGQSNHYNAIWQKSLQEQNLTEEHLQQLYLQHLSQRPFHFNVLSARGDYVIYGNYITE